MRFERRTRRQLLSANPVANFSLVSNQGRIQSAPILQITTVSNSSSRNKMMSNPPSVLQQRQRLHRRQNSTPVAFEAMKVPNLPPAIQRHNSHRRGQSLDQRSPTRGQHRQTGSTVSNTNQGSITTGQQILREAQQQKLARPGQPIQSPLSPQCGTFQDQTINQNGLFDATTMNAILQEQALMQVSRPLQQCFPPDLSMPTSAGLESMDAVVDENHQHYFQSTHGGRRSGGSGGMNERSMSQPDLQLYVRQRPITPAQQMNSGESEDPKDRQMY